MTETQRVYKSGGKNNEYLITTDVDPKDTNMHRDGVVNKNTAKFRCKKAFVVEIEHKETGELVESVRSGLKHNFIYKVGSYIEEPSYDNNIDSVCSQGIHFFLTREPSMLYEYIPVNYNGVYKSWHNNGQLRGECEYKNGERDGLCKIWYNNGHSWYECEYKNGVQEGSNKVWHNNGKLRGECKYKNGKIEGPSKIWYESGQLYVECEYKNGLRDGPYKEWCDNGQLKIECEYKNGEIVGPIIRGTMYNHPTPNYMVNFLTTNPILYYHPQPPFYYPTVPIINRYYMR